MEANRFDHLTRTVAGSRRGLLAAVATLPLFGGILAEDAAAKKKKKATFCLNGQTVTAPKKKKQSMLDQGATLGACKSCATACGECSKCDPTTGACVRDRAKDGKRCGQPGQICGDKGCWCEENSCPDCKECLSRTTGLCRMDSPARCPEDEKCCSDICSFTARDPNNCGDCGVVCAINEECAGGQCVAIPCDGPADCPQGTSCVDEHCKRN